MAESAVLDAPVKQDKDTELKAFCKHVAEKHNAGERQVAIDDLPRIMQQVPTLAKALSRGLAEIGRPNYSETIASSKIKTEKGQPVLDSEFRQIVIKEHKVNVDNGWSWTSLKGGDRKPLTEILAEDKNLPDSVKLHVRLTTDGLAFVS